MEFVVTEIEWGVDGFKRLKVYVDFLLFTFFRDDGATVDY